MTISKLTKNKKNSSLLVYVLHKTRNKEFLRRSRAKNGKEIYKKVWRTCEVDVLLIKPIVFWTCSLLPVSLDLKVPTLRKTKLLRRRQQWPFATLTLTLFRPLGEGWGGGALLLQKLNNFKTVQAIENFEIKVVVTCTLTLTLPLHPRFGSQKLECF